MMQTALEGTHERTGRKVLPGLVIALLAMGLALPVWSADKNKDEETLRNAASVLEGMVNSDNVPKGLLEKANCVLVVPGVKKFAVGVGGSGGRGALSCRQGEKFEGKWSTPAMYSIGGASVGLQVGGSSTDFVLLIMDDKGAEAVLHDKTKLGSDASVAAGPGATAQSAEVGGVDVLTYARTKGLFAGVSLDGATLHQDGDANMRLYGKKLSSQEIIRGHDVKATEGGEAYVSMLDSKAGRHGM
jgi:lipid-binding SYLF domain-containing protein